MKKPRNIGIACPHCGTRATARSSEEETPISREIRYRCENDDCGYAFVAQLVILRGLRPSLRPNPDVHIPLSPFRARPGTRTPANDDHPLADNDDAPPRPAADASLTR